MEPNGRLPFGPQLLKISSVSVVDQKIEIATLDHIARYLSILTAMRRNVLFVNVIQLFWPREPRPM